MRWRFVLLTTLIAITFALPSQPARADEPVEPTTEELKRQLEVLRSKVQKLELNQQSQLTKEEVDATVARVMADAQQRSKLFNGTGFTAGWKDGFKIQSDDGNFVLQPQFQLQVRYVANLAENATPSGGDDIQSGFEVRRMKIGFKGNAFTPDLTYNFRWATAVNSGTLVLENAYVQYRFKEDWLVRLGQWKEIWTHEETVSSAHQLAVDRSLLNELLGGGNTSYVQGIALGYWPHDSKFRAEIAYIDGYDTGNTGWQNDPSTGGNALITPGLPPGQGTDWGVTARVEYAFAGSWKEYDQLTAMGSSDDLLVLGAGMDFSQASSNNIWFHTVDLQWFPAGAPGLSLYGAYIGVWRDYENTFGAQEYDWGFLVQAGYMLNKQWEVFARYDLTETDDLFSPTGPSASYNEITVGVNYYLKGQAAKFTVDFVYLPNGVPDAPTNLNGIGLVPNDDAEFAIRAQFQLLL